MSCLQALTKENPKDGFSDRRRRENGDSLVAQLVKNWPVVQETAVLFLGREDPLEKGEAAQASVLAWTTPWTAEPMALHGVRHD